MFRDLDCFIEKLIDLLSALFCLPPKCGCTSYQRALGSQLTKEFLREGKQCKKRPCYDQSVMNKAKNDLSKRIKNIYFIRRIKF